MLWSSRKTTHIYFFLGDLQETLRGQVVCESVHHSRSTGHLSSQSRIHTYITNHQPTVIDKKISREKNFEILFSSSVN